MTNEKWVLKLEADDPKFRIEGESLMSLYSRWINVDRIDLPARLPRDVSNGQSTGKRKFAPIRITSNDQTAQRGILFAVQKSSRFKRATLAMIRPDERSNSKPIVQIDMTQVGINFVKIVSNNTTAKDDDTEYEFSLVYGTINEQGETRQRPSDDWAVSG